MTRLRQIDGHDDLKAVFSAKKTSNIAAGFFAPASTRLEVGESDVYTPSLSIPKLPVMQPYGPTDGAQMPFYPVAIKMPGLVDHIPVGIAELLAEHGVPASNLDIGLVAQSNTGTRALLRPHPWIHPDAPRAQANYSIKSPNVLVGTCAIGTTPVLLKPTKDIHTHSQGAHHTVVFSPNNMAIDGLNDDDNLAMYSVVIDKSAAPAKAVVTLHLLCTGLLLEQMLAIGAKEDERTYTQIVDEMLALDAIDAQPSVKAALKTYRNGEPLPSHTLSGNPHSLQDTRTNATRVLQGHLAGKGFDLSALDAQNAHGWSPLTYSTAKGKIDCIRACIAKGADPLLANGLGKSALDIARDAENAELVKLFESVIERNKSDKLYKFCVKYGFDFYNLEKHNAHGVTPVTVAASHNDLDILNIILERGAKIYKPNAHGNTPMKIAENKGYAAIQEALTAHSLSIIESFAKRYGFNKDELDAENAHKVTMLTVAVEKNMPEVVHALVEAGADVDLANGWGKTPIAIAKRGGYAGLQAYLESKSAVDPEPEEDPAPASPRNSPA